MEIQKKKKKSKQAEEGKRRQTGLYYPVNHSSFASDKEYHWENDRIFYTVS